MPELMDEATPTVGVEEEFLLVDPISGAPVGRNAEVADAARTLGIELQLELTSCQIESSTGVHTESSTLAAELRSLRTMVDKAARDCGARAIAVGAPPTVPHDFPVTDTPRYQRIAQRFGMLAHEQGVCGAHVHVGVPDRDTAVMMSNFLRPWLPILLALTANSAIYRGADTGFASWRSILWQRWPSAGPPPYFDSADNYDAMVEIMLATGGILDPHMVYLDVRPSDQYSTVEVRVSDVPATVDETVLLALLIRGIVTTARTALRHGRTAPEIKGEALRAAYWAAAHNGLAGDAVDVVHERVLPAREMVANLVDHVDDALDAAGDRAEVGARLAEVWRSGNGAMRQVAAFGPDHDVAAVVADATRATLIGCEPTPRQRSGSAGE